MDDLGMQHDLAQLQGGCSLDRIVLVKAGLVTSHASHFAGGKHAFLCCARALASAGLQGQLLVGSMSGAAPCVGLDQMTTRPVHHVQPQGHTPSPGSGDQAQVVSWTWPPAQQAAAGQSAKKSHSIVCHAVLKDDVSQVQWQAGMSGVVEDLAGGYPPDSQGTTSSASSTPAKARCWVMVDADDCQLAPKGSGCHQPVALIPVVSPGEAAGSTATMSSHHDQEHAPSLFELLADRHGSQCVVLVQNVHFLPFGPSGTAARTQGLLKAWSSVGLVVCVSQFVAGYLRQHWPTAAALKSQPVHQPPIIVVPLSAWGCFGQGPFQDYSDRGVAQLRHSSDLQRLPSIQRPVVAVLKLTPEKGCSIVAQLAKEMSEKADFLVVAGDPQVAEVFKGVQNVQVVPPGDGVDWVLKRAAVVLAPSIWLEAWGMVVTEACLRGIPVIVSDAGGLPEAGFGVCPVVHINPIIVPHDITGTPCWAARQYPTQEVQLWIDQLRALLSDPEGYVQLSAAAREAAQAFVAQGPHHLNSFVHALHSSSACSS